MKNLVSMKKIDKIFKEKRKETQEIVSYSDHKAIRIGRSLINALPKNAKIVDSNGFDLTKEEAFRQLESSIKNTRENLDFTIEKDGEIRRFMVDQYLNDFSNIGIIVISWENN